MMPSPAAPITQVLHEHRRRLVMTYSLFALEMLGTLTRPWFLGVAVDGLLAGHAQGLIRLTVVHLAWLVAGTARHMYDTRTFTAIYTSFVVRWLERTDGEHDLSKRSAHSTLARQVVDFLEYDINYVIEALYNVIGSLVILYFYDRTVMAICLVVLAPMLVLSWIYGRTTRRLSLGKHDELEKQVDIIASRDRAAIATHYHALRRWQIRLSDQEAWNFGATEVLVLLVITGSLLVTTSLGRTTLHVGAIIVIYNYILRFASGLETVPYTIQRLGALQDIVRRMTPGALPA